MSPLEFLSILSSKTTGISFTRFQELYRLIDIYDVKKDPSLLFGPSLPSYLSENKNWFDEVLRDFEFYHKNEIHHLYPNHPLYPEDFYTLEKPPLFLSLEGDLSCLNKNKVSVVGSRHPTAAALEWMDIHLTPLVEDGAVLVSGAARGIDQRAHLVSIKNQKPTIAFLPSGLRQVYPPEFSKWKEKIVEYGGLIVSEYEYSQPIHRHHFHERNRMIAKMGLFVLVCEARRKSGSTMTARLAIDNSKTVCVLPGFPSAKNSQGCLDLLFQGAIPVRDYEDLTVLLSAEYLSAGNSFQNLREKLFVPDLLNDISAREKKDNIRDP